MPPRHFDGDLRPMVDVGPKTEVTPVVTEVTHSAKAPPMRIVWHNIFWMGLLHTAAVYGLYLLIWAHPLTWMWTGAVYWLSALGITAGAHRLWAHRCYRAKVPLKIFLALCNSLAFQNDVIEWSRDHRAHHRHSETDADPHNARRGFFFAHIGWLLVRKHPEVKAKGKLIDMGDLTSDPVLIVQRKLYLPSVLIMCFIFPTVIPVYFWGESVLVAFFACAVMRYVASLNVTWLVNSAAHMWGNKPYDRTINPVENILVTFSAIGEGFHNYHHTFPHDYSASEFGWKLNPTTFFIDTMALIGQATHLKKIPQDLVDRRKQRTGDGSEGFGLTTSKSQE